MVAGGKDPTSTQIRGSSLLLAGQVFASVVNLAVQIMIVRYLSQESYGAFAYALSVVMVIGPFVSFGMRRGVARYMPIYEETGEPHRAAGTMVLAVGSVLALGLAAVLIIAAFRGVIAGSFADDTTAVTVLVLLSLMAPIGALENLLDGVFAVFGHPRAIVSRKYILAPSVRLAVVALLILNQAGLVFLAGAYVVTGLVVIISYTPLLVRTLRERGLLQRFRRGGFTMPTREVLSFTVPLVSDDVTEAVLIGAGGVALGLLATPLDVAELRAVTPVVLTMRYVFNSFGLLLVPLAARMYAHGARAELNKLYWRTAVWTGVLVFPIFLTCVVIPEPVTVLLFGERYADAAPVLAVFAVGGFIDAATGHNSLMLGVFGRVRSLTLSNVPALLTMLILVVVLVPPLAGVGAALATSTAFAVLALIRQIALARSTDVDGLAPPAIPIYAAMAVVTVACVAVQLTLAPPTFVGISTIAVGMAVVAAVARSELALAETFPEIARIPLLGKLVGAQTGSG